MATYSGNASLSQAVKDRVLSTFQQSLTLYKEGRSAEVVEGCTLILRMDPMFDPARKLLEKTRNPNAAINVDSLLPAAPGSDILNEARAALAARDFQRAAELTSEVLRDDFTNEEARLVNDTARERIEAAPFVEQFIRKSEMFARQGNASAARSELEKARALDDGHPGIRRVAESMKAAEPPAAPSFNSGSSPSFVVETPPPAPTARSAAQAADFGFTFEEEKPAEPESPFGAFSFGGAPSPAAPAPPAAGGFSFDTPVAPPAPPSAPSSSSPFGAGGFSFDTPATPAGGGFDFGPAAPPAGGDQRKIQQYLADGDRAASAGDYQQAIDLWSRIFLIDVTNDEASHRIESAKAKRREIESKVEAIINAGELAYNARDNETARAKFNEALRLDPGNLTANDYLGRMSNTAGEKSAPAFEAPFAIPPPSRGDIFDDDQLSGSYDSLKPPDLPVAKAPAKAKAPAAAPTPSKNGSRMGVLITIAAVVIVAAVGWFAWSKYLTKPAYDPSATQAIFRQADALAKRNRFDQAIAMLRDVKPADPRHDKALEMIADLQHKKSQAAEMLNGRPSAIVYDESITAGRTAFDGHDYDAAKTAFDNAARIKPLPPDISTMYAAASQQVAKLEVAKALFSEQKYQDAIANLDPLLQADPQNQSIRRMLTSAHFDLGAIALQEERLPDAIREFDLVLKADPNDELAKRSKTLADRYSGQPKDLLYKIYVKYLPLRKT
ncbi:MAG TPA: tetratricopeptide repeat protein [Thermoanaerobaculia bacterium]|nr:tetratricopeptide repeat protein [Thermoanaerobaculia bacterium]